MYRTKSRYLHIQRKRSLLSSMQTQCIQVTGRNIGTGGKASRPEQSQTQSLTSLLMSSTGPTTPQAVHSGPAIVQQESVVKQPAKEECVTPFQMSKTM